MSFFQHFVNFQLFENDSKSNIFSSVRALDELFFRFWDYDFRISHVKIKKKCSNFQLIWEWLQNWHFLLCGCANFQLIWEWLQNQLFQLRLSSLSNFQILRLWFLNSTRQNKEVCQFSAYLRMAPKPTFSAPWELSIKFSYSEIMIFEFYTTK